MVGLTQARTRSGPIVPGGTPFPSPHRATRPRQHYLTAFIHHQPQCPPLYLSSSTKPTTSPTIMSTTVVTKPRRVPPPCWTQDEAQSLILAYRDRWFALRRANLKAADWDHVAKATAAASSSSSSPPKTALQCRHKMEKLRKRYRAEKQRASNYPGRFFSSWALFHLMDEMESDPDRKPIDEGEFGGKGRNLVNVDRSFSPNGDFDGIGGSVFDLGNELYQNSRFNYRFGENSGFYSEDNEYVNRGGFPSRTRSNGKSDVNLNNSFNQHRDYGIRSDRDYVPSGSLKRNAHCKEFDGYASLSGSKFGKKRSVVGMERDVDPVADLASSIMMLGEGFERMERMKMEMTWEIEKRRMETELKRTEAMNESLQQFVDALLERKKKKKAMVESSHA
ncbi:PREDICTED: uncharacterized protein LOC101297845 [Fragaria vesca subsp. vesca]